MQHICAAPGSQAAADAAVEAGEISFVLPPPLPPASPPFALSTSLVDMLHTYGCGRSMKLSAVDVCFFVNVRENENIVMIRV